MMMKHVVDAMGDSFPIALITLYAIGMGLAAKYYTRDLRHIDAEKAAHSQSGKRMRAAVAHKAS